MRENKVVLKFEELNKTFLYKWFRDNYKFDVRYALQFARKCRQDKQIDFDGDLDKAMKFLDDAPAGSSLRLITDVLFEKCHIPVGNVYA
jgi:hypothetical protein